MKKNLLSTYTWWTFLNKYKLSLPWILKSNKFQVMKYMVSRIQCSFLHNKRFKYSENQVLTSHLKT